MRRVYVGTLGAVSILGAGLSMVKFGHRDLRTEKRRKGHPLRDSKASAILTAAASVIMSIAPRGSSRTGEVSGE
jgi:diphthamide biosynthesis methyltransferase